MSRDRKKGRWRIEDSLELYGLDTWGRDLFSANSQGHLIVHPDGTGAPGIDLKNLVDELVERGIEPPILVRFSDVVRARLDAIHKAFEQAIAEYGYRGSYRGVYPIKVNQNRFLVRDLVSHGRAFHYGLEAGSKPELMAVVAMLDDEEALVICNGYKDEEYVETALLASRLGPKVILVAEKPAELAVIAEVSKRTGIRPLLGMRSRLSTRGAGHWEASGGDRSKFGFSPREAVEAVDFLRERELLDSFVLLHFHLGSQISSIRNIKDALREAGWLYVNLAKMGVPLEYLDVGGGLGVDYDGSQTNYPSSMNYSLQEYANDIVYGLMEVCEPSGVAHPILITESGRATVAHHAILVFEVLDVGEFRIREVPEELPEGTASVVVHLMEAYGALTSRNVRETYHDALQYRDECLSLFNLGHLSLADRVLAEDVFWTLCHKLREHVRKMSRPDDELLKLEHELADTYYCNFSVFQSLPDSWAIDQLFPIVPIHHLHQRPERRGIIADMTCDSDGTINKFTGRRDVRDVLELHTLGDEPYYLAAFLVGAYQEILGDLHNLFGDTHTVHVSFDAENGYSLDHVVSGDTVTDVLAYVGYNRHHLVAQVRRCAERSIRAGRMARQEARKLLQIYESGLAGYTYLERD